MNEVQTYSSLPSSKEKAQILQKVSLLSDLKENIEALESLSLNMNIREFDEGQVLIREGELGNEFYVLIEGQVSVYKKTPDGDVFKIVILSQKHTPAFGEGGLIESEPRSATITCDMKCRCLVLDQKDFLHFCNQKPEWAVPILKKIALNLMSRLRQTSNDLMLLHKALMNEIRG